LERRLARVGGQGRDFLRLVQLGGIGTGTGARVRPPVASGGLPVAPPAVAGTLPAVAAAVAVASRFRVDRSRAVLGVRLSFRAFEEVGIGGRLAGRAAVGSASGPAGTTAAPIVAAPLAAAAACGAAAGTTRTVRAWGLIHACASFSTWSRSPAWIRAPRAHSA